MTHYLEKIVHSHMHFMHPFGAIPAASENGSRAAALPPEKF
jgi:hypothetical protein